MRYPRNHVATRPFALKRHNAAVQVVRRGLKVDAKNMWLTTNNMLARDDPEHRRLRKPMGKALAGRGKWHGQ
tara:strand:- start:6558 stop:6773 length:216 start_codon:yes stop_codon:yes gene_type:complete